MKDFSEVFERAKDQKKKTTCVAAAADRAVLGAVKAASDMDLIEPVLTGDTDEVAALCREIGLKPLDIIGADTSEAAVSLAVQAVREGKAQILMKGLVNTSVFMHGVLDRENGLRSGRLLSMMAVYQVPSYHKLLFCSDSGINVAPDLTQKKQILRNLVNAVRGFGLECPKVAALTANELVNPRIQATVDAAGLVEAVQNGELPSCVIEGPIALDVAFDPRAAAHKKLDSKVSGDVDLLLFPNMEAGNMLGKSWITLSHAPWGGVVLGATHPIILGSRSDTAEIKCNSIALACLSSCE